MLGFRNLQEKSREESRFSRAKKRDESSREQKRARKRILMYLVVSYILR